MRHDNDIEELLSQTPGPRAIVGPHRAHLKTRLLESMQKETSDVSVKMKTWQKGLLACGIAVLLTAGSWAAYDQCFRTFVVEEEVQEAVVNPDGSISRTSRTTVVTWNGEGFTQDDADRMHQQMKQAIAAGDYELVEVKEEESKPAYYVYKLTLEDGKTVGYGSNTPLPEPEAE